MKKILFCIAILFVTYRCNCPNQEVRSEKIIKEIVTPQQAVDALIEGNKRFVEGNTQAPHQDTSYVKQLAEGQHPYAVVVACSDSRVPVELLFDQGFGDLFVVRTAGNTLIDNITLGSIDYAVNHLNVKAVVVLGHTKCGAITSVVEMGHSQHQCDNDHEVAEMVNSIAQHIEEHRGTNKNVDQAVHDNVLTQVKLYMTRPFIQKKIEEGELIVVPAIYDITSGEVKIL